MRPWREEDGGELHRLLSDPAVRGGRNFPPERIARLAEDSLRQWHVKGFGFEQHGLERIISVTAAAHAAARRVMETAGLTYQGTRHWMNPDVPVVWYAIDRATWSARRG